MIGDYDILYMRGCPLGNGFKALVATSVEVGRDMQDVAMEVTAKYKCQAKLEPTARIIRFSNLRGTRLWVLVKFHAIKEAA